MLSHDRVERFKYRANTANRVNDATVFVARKPNRATIRASYWRDYVGLVLLFSVHIRASA